MKIEKKIERNYYDVSISVIVDKRYEKKNGYNVSIQVYYGREYLYHKLGYTIKSWSEITPEIEDYFRSELDYVYENVKNLFLAREFSISALKKILQAPKCNTINDAMREKIDEFRKKGQISSAGHIECALKKFNEYFGEVAFDKINAAMFNEYKERLFAEGKTVATVLIYLNDFKAVMNKCIALKKMDIRNFPFKQNKYDVLKCEMPICPNKRTECYFSKAEMDKIFEYYENSTLLTKKWISLFLFSYLAGGINLADMLRLKYDQHYFDTEGKELKYVRKKTEFHNKKIICIPLFDYMKELIYTANLAQRNTAEPKLGDYVFPFLNDKMTQAEVKTTIQMAGAYIGSQLKTVAKKLGINKKPSMTYARHSFATNMRRLGIPSEYIEYAMGHVIKGVAGNYFGGYTFEQMTNYNSQLLSSHNIKVEAA